MKTHSRPSRKGLRQGWRRGNSLKRAGTANFIPRVEQLEDRALMANDLVAAFAFSLADSNGAPLSSSAKLSVNQTLNLVATVQDVRDDTAFDALLAEIRASNPDDPRTAFDLKGFFQAYLNLDFNPALLASVATTPSQITFGTGVDNTTPFSLENADKHGTINNATGKFTNFGDYAAGFGGSANQNGGVLPFFMAPFKVTHVPVAGVPDTPTTSQGTAIDIPVLANDKVEGTTTFIGSHANLSDFFDGQTAMIYAGGDDPNTRSQILPLTSAAQFSFSNATLGLTGRKEIVLTSSTSTNGATLSIREVNGVANDNNPSNNVVFYTPPAGFTGQDTFTYKLRNADDPSGPTQTITVTVTVNPVNQAPSFASSTAATQTINENAGTQTINLSSITAGSGENQALRFTATSNNQALLPNGNITRNYTSPNTTGSITFTTAPNASGTAIVSVQLFDAGFDGIAGNGDDAASAVRQFTFNVLSVNDAPRFTLSSSAQSYTEGSAAVQIDPALALSDVEGNLITSAKVSVLAGGVALPEDVLAFNPALFPGTVPSGLTFSAQVNGEITVSGTFNAFTYQSALKAFTYRNTSTNPSTVQRTINFSATDNGSPAATGTGVRNLNVVPVNDAPLLGLNPPATNVLFNEHGPAVFIAQNLTLSDDGPTLKSAKVQITSGLQPNLDQLTFTPEPGITGNYDAATGVLTFTNVASVNAYGNVLRSVKFNNPTDSPGLSRSVLITVDDGSAANNTASIARNIDIKSNAAPVLGTLSTKNGVYTEQKAAVVVDPKLTLVDPDGTTLVSATVKITDGYQAGKDRLTVTSTTTINKVIDIDASVPGQLTFTSKNPLAPATVKTFLSLLKKVKFASTSDDPGTVRKFEFKVDDGSPANGTATRTRVFDIKPVNDKPKLTSSSGPAVVTNAAAAVVVDGAMVASDPDNKPWVGATVKFSSGFKLAEDRLSFVATPHITGSFNVATKTLTLTGVADVSEYQAALQSVTYNNIAAVPTTAKRGLTFTVNDGALKASLVRTVSFSLGTTPQPSRISGFVYLDAGQVGAKEAADVGVGGVTITLTKPGDATFTPQIAVTNRAGFYEFVGLSAGTYSVTQTQPGHLGDGVETAGSALVTIPAASNDVFSVDLTGNGGQVLANNNFGETVPALGANPVGLSLAVAPGGQTQWYALGSGWPGFQSASVSSVSFDGAGQPQTAQIRVVDANGAAFTALLSLVNNPIVQVSGNQASGIVLEIFSSSGGLDFQPSVSAEGESETFFVADFSPQSPSADEGAWPATSRATKARVTPVGNFRRLALAEGKDEPMDSAADSSEIDSIDQRVDDAEYAEAVDALLAAAWNGV